MISLCGYLSSTWEFASRKIVKKVFSMRANTAFDLAENMNHWFGYMPAQLPDVALENCYIVVS